MKNSIIVSTILIFELVIINLYAQTLYNGIGHIPQGNQENWNEAGLLQDIRMLCPDRKNEILAALAMKAGFLTQFFLISYSRVGNPGSFPSAGI